MLACTFWWVDKDVIAVTATTNTTTPNTIPIAFFFKSISSLTQCVDFSD
jgi:hypothetical protein